MNTSDTFLSYWELPTACCIEPDVFHHTPRILATQRTNEITQLTLHMCAAASAETKTGSSCVYSVSCSATKHSCIDLGPDTWLQIKAAQ